MPLREVCGLRGSSGSLRGKSGTLSNCLRGNPVCRRPAALASCLAGLTDGMDHSSEGQMRSLKLGLAAIAVISMLSATAQADCIKVESLGEAVTHDIAYVFATHGLANIIYGKGRVGKGPVHTTCKDGSGTTTCRSSQTACSAGPPHTCL